MFDKKIIVIGALLGTGILCVSAIADSAKNEFTNLQVLPKNISKKELQQIMVDDFQDGLGVGCNYCHAQEKGSLHLDYASDEKPEKEIARAMMRMTMEINQKYFGVDHSMIGDSTLIISCEQCHQGTAHPGKL